MHCFIFSLSIVILVLLSSAKVLTAWSRSEDKAKGVRRAEELFDDIEGRYAAGETDFRADTAVYNALINCENSSSALSFVLPYPLTFYSASYC